MEDDVIPLPRPDKTPPETRITFISVSRDPEYGIAQHKGFLFALLETASERTVQGCHLACSSFVAISACRASMILVTAQETSLDISPLNSRDLI